MTKEKGIPQIRFSGFTDTWEQREVSNVAMISTGGTPSTAINEYWNPKQVPWLSSGEVHKKYITYTDDKISNEGLNHSSARMIKQNSVLIALAGQGKTRGTVAINRISLSTNQSIAAMTFAPDICPEFVFSNLESRYDELRKVSSGDGTRGGLNKQLVSEIQIPYTSLNEQRKIGQFFTHLDRLITLHQRKYDKLTKVKKAMLEKMFPKNGSLYPEIRFKGFTDAWEQREVSNVAMISTGGTPSTAINEYWNPKQVPWLSSGEVHKKYITYTDDKISNEGLNHSSARMIKQNSVLIALAGQGKTRGTVAINRISLSTNQSIAAMTFAPDICPEFVFSNLESRYDELRKVSSGDGTRGGLNKQLVSEIQIPYTSLNEQRKIGQFFTHLDRLITLHQRKLEKLKNIKKACLEKMFV